MAMLHCLQAWPVVLARVQAAVVSLEKLAAQTGVTDVDEAMSRLTAGAARQPAWLCLCQSYNACQSASARLKQHNGKAATACLLCYIPCHPSCAHQPASLQVAAKPVGMLLCLPELRSTDGFDKLAAEPPHVAGCRHHR